MNPNNQAQDQIWGWQGKIRTIADRARYILGKDILSDVTFRVVQSNGDVAVDIQAHKFLLALGSEVFETMFFGSLAENSGVVKILDIDPEPFRLMLRYIYHDQIGPFDKSTAFSTLYAAKKYGIPILKNACEEYLKTNVATDNCLTWFVQEKVDLWGSSVLQSPDFLNISPGVLKQILSRDTLKVKEADVCNAAIRWATQRCKHKQMACTGPNLRFALEEALFLVRFPIMTSQEVAAGPAKMGLLLSDEISQLFQYWFANEKLPANFITKPRQLSTELKVSRFTGTQNGWTYRDGTPDVIEFSVSSTNKREWRAQLGDCITGSATISLIAVGLYVQNPLPIGKRVTAAMKLYAAQGYDGIHTNVRTINDHRGMPVIDLQEFGNSWTVLAAPTESNIAKFKLNKPLPIKEGIRFTISIQITGMGQSMYGLGGTHSFVTNAGNSVGKDQFTVTFRDASDPVHGRIGYNHAYGYNHQTGSNTCGSTTVAQGQIPELYFEISE